MIYSGIKKISQILDRKAKRHYLILLLLLVIKSILDGFGLGLIAPFIAAIGQPSVIFDNEIFQYLNSFIGIRTSQELIIWMSIIMVSYFLIKNIFVLMTTYYQSRLLFTQRAFQSKRLFNSYMNAPYNYHLEHNSAELDRNIRYEIPNTYAFIDSMLHIASNIFLVIAIFIILIVASWQAVLSMTLVLSVTSFLILHFSGRFSNILGVQLQRSQLQLGQALKEGLSTIIESKLGNIESFFPKRYFKHYMVTSRSQWRQATINSSPQLLFELVAICILCGAIIILSLRQTDIISLLPIIGLFAFAFVRLLPAVNLIVRNLNSLKFVLPAVNVVHQEFKKFQVTDNQAFNLDHPQKHSKDFSSIKFKDVSFSYANPESNVIKNITFQLNKGQSIAFIGPSGAGKTTLVNLILGLLDPSKGQILVNNKAHSKQKKMLRSIIGYVPQNITLIDASIKENIALGSQLNDIDNQKVESVIKESHLEKLIEELPEKLDTVIGENGVRLSGGQRQRLGIARALYSNPKILVFDEATSSLDIETEKRITEEITKLSGNKTMIFVTHRISTIRNCETIFYLKDGAIISFGTYNELMERNKEFKDLVQDIGS